MGAFDAQPRAPGAALSARRRRGHLGLPDRRAARGQRRPSRRGDRDDDARLRRRADRRKGARPAGARLRIRRPRRDRAVLRAAASALRADAGAQTAGRAQSGQADRVAAGAISRRLRAGQALSDLSAILGLAPLRHRRFGSHHARRPYRALGAAGGTLLQPRGGARPDAPDRAVPPGVGEVWARSRRTSPRRRGSIRQRASSTGSTIPTPRCCRISRSAARPSPSSRRGRGSS